jgi:DNA polymerase-4
MFVSVARRADPDGAGKARLLVVGGTARSRGVVCSASYEARQYGLHAGMSIARAVRLCPQAMYVPVPGKECQEAHRSIRAVLARWAPVVAPASIDEFYLDLTGTERLYHHEPLADTAVRIRESVRNETGFTLSIGGSTNRLIAKMAAERAKPRPGTSATGVLIVTPGEEAAFMADCTLAEIPGVGPKLQAELRRRGLTRVREALALDQKTLAGWVGNATSRWLFHCFRGEGSGEVEIRPENKSISHESTFSKDLSSDESLESRLLRLLTALTAQLRQDRLATRCITVKLRDHDFKTRQAGHTLREPVCTDRALFGVAKDLLRRLRDQRRVPARLIGVSLSALQSTDGPLQLELPMPAESTRETSRDRLLAEAVDRIARKLGAAAIKPARLADAPGPRIHISFPPPRP